MTRFRLASLLLPAGLVASVLACSTSEPTGTSTDDVASETPIAPTDWVACWIVPDAEAADPFFAADEVHCKGLVAPDYPLQFQEASVEVVSAKGNAGWKRFGPADADVLVTKVWRADYPVELAVKVFHGRAAQEALRLPYGFRQKVTFATHEAATVAAPATLKQPFALWAIDLENRMEGESLFFQTKPYPVDIAPWLDGANFTIPDTGKSVVEVGLPFVQSRVEGETVALVTVAPSSGSLTGTLSTAAGELPVTIDGPGRWRATAAGLTRRAGDASEDAGLFVDEAAAPSEGGEADGGEAGAVPSERIGPDCGGSKEKCCAGDTCASGAYCSKNGATYGTCVACGLEAQACCPADACAAGSYCSKASQTYNTCKACGGEGQDCCPTDRCGDGSYCSKASQTYNTCKACGGEGEDCCPGDRCDGAFRCSKASTTYNRCVAN